MTTNDAPCFPRSFPQASTEFRRLLHGAVANGLEAVDVYTIADLQELSGHRDEELAALLVCMFLALREGSVCLEASPEALLRRLDGVIGEKEAAAWAEKIGASLQQARFPELIGVNDSDVKPVILHAARGKALLYFQKYLKHERALQTLLRQRLSATTETVPPEKLRPLFGKVISEHAAAGIGIKFGDEQKLAIGLALLRDLAVISGGPGTGKTTVVSAVLNCLIRGGCAADRIALACPTGRAAQRLTESLRRSNAGILPAPDMLAACGTAPLAAQTLHKLLAFSPRTGTFGHHRENPLPADVVVVDEVSMVDVVLMSRLLEALSPGARLILLGDKDQLPSVEAGSVLADLMPRDNRVSYSKKMAGQLRYLTGVNVPSAPGAQRGPLTDAVVILRENYRSQQHITAVAQQINDLGDAGSPQQAQQLVAQLPRLKLDTEPAGGAGEVRFKWPQLAALKQSGALAAGGCYLLDHSHRTDIWHKVLDAWARHHYLAGVEHGTPYPELIEEAQAPADGAMSAAQEAIVRKILAVVNGARVLTLIRRGPWGCEGVNSHLARMLQPGRERRGHARLFAGAPVLITANDYALQLFNGDVGVALSDPSGALRVAFERQDENGQRRYMVLPVDMLPNHELAFAMTVHKSQGSEYGQVLLALPSEGALRLQNRQLVYTAITRARQLAVCYGTPSALSAAIHRALVRSSGLDLSTEA